MPYQRYFTIAVAFLAGCSSIPERSPAGLGPMKCDAQLQYVQKRDLEWRLVRPFNGNSKIMFHRADHPNSPLLNEQDFSKQLSWFQQERLIDDRVFRSTEKFRGEGCPSGMVRVKGRMLKAWYKVDTLQNQACTDKPWDDRCLCRHYDPEKLKNLYDTFERAQPPERLPLDFCMDRFEYPNVQGLHPAIMVTWLDAEKICAQEGKRLCSEREWTFSCEGEEMRPYGYGTGYDRDSEACNIDRWIQGGKPNPEVLMRDREKQAAIDNLKSVYAGVASGALPACRSEFGVYDLAGNVDEWTTWSDAKGRKGYEGGPRDGKVNNGRGWESILKGGFWSAVRSRCRPSTSSHEPNFLFYQQGFRCCADAK